MAMVRRLTLLLTALLVSCSNEPPSPPAAPRPAPGLSLSGPASEVRSLLRRTAAAPEGVERSHLGLAAEAAAARLDGCSGAARGHSPLDILALLERLRCAPGPLPTTTALSARGERGELLAEGTLHHDQGGLTLELSLANGAREAFGGLFVEDDTAAAPWVVPEDALASAAAHATSAPLPPSVLAALGVELGPLDKAGLSAALTGRWAALLLPFDDAPALRLAVAAEATSPRPPARGPHPPARHPPRALRLHRRRPRQRPVLRRRGRARPRLRPLLAPAGRVARHRLERGQPPAGRAAHRRPRRARRPPRSPGGARCGAPRGRARRPPLRLDDTHAHVAPRRMAPGRPVARSTAPVKRLFLLLAVLVVGAAAAWWSQRSLAAEEALTAVCEAADRRDTRAVVAAFTELAALDDGERGLDCLCLATLDGDDRDVCLDALGRALGARDTYVPDPVVARVASELWLERGQLGDAQRVVERARTGHPGDPDLFGAAALLALQSGTTSDATLRRLREQATTPDHTLALARALHATGRTAEAASTLAAAGPPRNVQQRAAWSMTLAQLAGFSGQRGLYDKLIASLNPSDPQVPFVVLEARFLVAKTGAIGQVDTKDIARLRALTALPESTLRQHDVFEFVFLRVIQRLAVEGDPAADALLTRAHRLFPDFGLTERDLRRSETGALLEGRGRIAFSSPKAGVLLLSTPTPLSVFEAQPLGAGSSLVVERPLARTPTRWALLEAEGRSLLGSGSVWPRKDATVTVTIAPEAGHAPRTYAPPTRAPADGKRRVVAVLIDSGDWAHLRYVVARGEAPFLGWAAGRGASRVLFCDPPTTAASLGKLLYPAAAQAPTAAAFVAMELGQIAFALNDGDKLAAAAATLAPARSGFFDAMRKARIDSLSLVPDVTRATTGHATATRYRPGRPPTPVALTAPREDLDAVLPTLSAWPAKRRTWIREIASSFDAVDDGLSSGAQLVVAHLNPTDLAAHNHLDSLDSGRQERGVSIVRDLYAYIDHRLGQVWGTLDGDDALLVFSDHGTTSSLAHREEGLFLLLAPSLSTPVLDRVPPAPTIEGVPWLLWWLLKADAHPRWPDGGFAALADGDGPAGNGP